MVAQQFFDFTAGARHSRLMDSSGSREPHVSMEMSSVRKNVLLVYAHPEPTSITRQLVDVSARILAECGHEVVHSDLYAMRWKAVFDEDDFPQRADPGRLSFIDESGH